MKALDRHKIVKKVMEMAKEDQIFIEKTAYKAISCGAVDINHYNVNEYALPKIILTAIYDELKDARFPLDKEHKETLANLKHFL